MQRHSVWIHWASRTVHFHQDDDTSVVLHTRCCSPDVGMDAEVDFILTQVRRSGSLYGDIAGASASTSAASGLYSSTSRHQGSVDRRTFLSVQKQLC